MTHDHIKTLRKTREHLVSQRRLTAEALAAGFERGEATERNVDEIVKLQAAIKAIDEAIEDEL